MRTSILLAALLLPLAAHAQNKEPDWSKIEVAATKVAGSIYVIDSAPGSKGSGGNIGVSVGSDGIVLIDDKFAPLAPKIAAALKTVSDKPVRFLINTHFHRDHTGGNAFFGKDATIIAHENTRKRLMEGGGPQKDEAQPPVALPVITFEDKVSVHLNGEDIRAIHFPSGHTDTDVVVFFTKSNVVHMGDHYFNGTFPFIDLEGGGSVHGFIANVDKVIGMIPADAKVIPGHGALSNVTELKAFLGMLKETTGIVEAGLKAGKTADQLKKDKVLAKYDTWGKGFIKTDDWIDTIAKDTKR